MSTPKPGDYIDIHVHGGRTAPGIFILETLMAHEGRVPVKTEGAAFTYGIHPWFLDKSNYKKQLDLVEEITADPEVIAIGEAGFDKLRGPSPELQYEVFVRQVRISENLRKPLIIHCVRAWDEVIAARKELKPSMHWMIHGFRGKIKQAEQLLSKGFWLSVWFEYALRPESAELFSRIPVERIFLETDGADVDIRDIYSKVSADMGIPVIDLKSAMISNYKKFFSID
jgi:TatD DNase family protein